VLYVDTTSKKLAVKNDAGFNEGRTQNFSTALQTPAAATLTYITGSALAIPSNKLQIGTCFRWTFDITKTAAGTATSTFAIAVGTTGSIADTARVSFTKPAGTAAVDTATVTITAICRGPLSALGIFVGNFKLVKNAAEAAGHTTTPSTSLTTVSGAFDVTTAALIVGLVVTTGALDAITVQMVQAEAWNL
jgi:hypothetical protein